MENPNRSGWEEGAKKKPIIQNQKINKTNKSFPVVTPARWEKPFPSMPDFFFPLPGGNSPAPSKIPSGNVALSEEFFLHFKDLHIGLFIKIVRSNWTSEGSP
jgi:hypothetical protein